MPSVSSTHLLIFAKQFAAMIRSRLPLVSVLDNLADETPQKYLRNVLLDVAEDVKHGIDLGDALEARPTVFSAVFVTVVKAGMLSGKLDSSLTQMATYLDNVDQLQRKLRAVLTYPIFMLVAFLAVFNGMIFGILPRFQQMYKNMNKKLPIPTQILLDIGEFWSNNWFYVIGGVAVVVLSFTTWIKTDDGRRVWDEVKLRLLLIGGIWRMAALARFLRTLAVQVHNEVRLLDALRLSAEVVDNWYIRDILLDISDSVENGGSITSSFREHEIFQGIVLQMIRSGEDSGTLDDLLAASADYFDSLLADRLNTIAGLINPVLTVFIGLAIAGMMIASFLPVFEMGSMSG
ncbi:MAG: type II secretion system F family protein [Alphaproteobacteria bacterium]